MSFKSSLADRPGSSTVVTRHRWHVALLVITICAPLVLNDCGLKQGLTTAVLMDYEDLTHFVAYYFSPPPPFVDPATSWNGVVARHVPGYRSFWVVFLICDLRNQGKTASAFPLDFHKFYVDTDVSRYYYRPLTPADVEGPAGQPSTPDIIAQMWEYFRGETEKGGQSTFSAGKYYGQLDYRFAILVTVKGNDIPTEPLDLGYDGYPNVLVRRNRPPEVAGDANAGYLRDYCQ